MITLSSVSKSFDSNLIVDELNLHVEEGERIAIIGESGCGKSTILRLILGLILPDKGSIQVNSQQVNQLDYRQLKKLRLSCGMLFQSGALFDSMSVFDNVAFGLLENYGITGKELRHKVSEALEMVGMLAYSERLPSQLSGGQRKRIGLARAIATGPKIMLYDEPTTGLDPVLSTIIEDLIVSLNKDLKVTSIVVSHQKSTILRTVDKIYMMTNGILLPYETPKTIMKSSNKDISFFMSGGIEH